MKFSISLL